MKQLFRIALVCIGVYGLLYWATNNPKSLASVKASVDAGIEATVSKAKEIGNNLTDEE
tara:strand:- start:975 stop:1148 length:174 start_codon:yes stop_codon:yes gene_type:complete